jgi:hypothetical protein
MKINIILTLIFTAALFISCKKLFNREVKCRDFQIKGEHYWFPLNVGDSVVFVNVSANIRKKFLVQDKRIAHTTKYKSDTGCGCFDYSGMLLTSGSDSLWFKNELKYIENKEGNYYEDIFFVINGSKSGFYETQRTILANYTVNGVNFSDVEFFSCANCQIALDVKKIYRVKNLGIISYELVNGEVWTNENLTKTGQTSKDSFTYLEETCE